MISSLSIIIPIFNEEKRIIESLKIIKKFLTKIKKKIKIQIIFVDDGSPDDSLSKAIKFIKFSCCKVGSGYRAVRLVVDIGL